MIRERIKFKHGLQQNLKMNLHVAKCLVLIKADVAFGSDIEAFIIHPNKKLKTILYQTSVYRLYNKIFF